MNFKTVRWTVLKRGRPAREGVPLWKRKTLFPQAACKKAADNLLIMSTYDPFGYTTITCYNINSDLFHYCFKEVKDIGIDFVLIELIQQLMAGIFIYFHFHVTVIKIQIIKDFEHAFAVIPHGVGRA